MADIAICRVGDTGSGICTGHSPAISTTGTITTGSSNVTNDELGIASSGDIITASCGHTGIITGSGSALVNDKNIARVGDSFSGTFSGTLTSGSGNTTGGG